MMNTRFISFKYKLTTIISAILVILLTVTYQFVRKELETQFIIRIKVDLRNTQMMIEQLLNDSFNKLFHASQAIIGHVFIKEILTDATLDQTTRDDLITNEIFYYYQETIDLVVTANAEGKILAANPVGKLVQDALKQTGAYINCYNYGVSTNFFLFHDNRYYEITAEPFFLNEEMIGLVCVGAEITAEALGHIKDIGNVDLAFLKKEQIFLSTEWDRDEKTNNALRFAFNRRIASDFNVDKVLEIEALSIQEVTLLNERFLYVITPFRYRPPLISRGDDEAARIIPTYIGSDNSEIVTTYALIKSLDDEMAFLKALSNKMILTGFIGVCVAITTGFLFSLKITRPIETLRQATREVEVGNFEHRVDIDSHDEFSILGNSFNDMITGLAEKERVRAAMDKVVSREIASEMLKGDIQLGGEERVATILFSDIRGFTALSEGLSPSDLLKLLNQYFTRMSSCIDAQYGVIDKYIGDAMMALFGVPTSHDDDARRAVLAARNMMDSLAEFNARIAKERGRVIEIGIGINTGKLVAGNMGAENRLNYTVLGDEVNLASRLEGLCKLYQAPIIISESTYTAITDNHNAADASIPTRELDSVQVKGKSKGIRIYQVFAADDVADRVTELLDRFQEAKALMFDKKFEQSLTLFGEIQDRWPKDGPSRYFINLVQRYRDQPALFDLEYQDGVYIATAK